MNGLSTRSKLVTNIHKLLVPLPAAIKPRATASASIIPVALFDYTEIFRSSIFEHRLLLMLFVVVMVVAAAMVAVIAMASMDFADKLVAIRKNGN